MHLLVLSAFRQRIRFALLRREPVSMHLLVLSAFRRQNLASKDADLRIVSMHLLVLSAFRHARLWK